MPITQDRLLAVTRGAQELASAISALKALAEQLDIPNTIAQLNALRAHTPDQAGQQIIASVHVALMALYNAVRETPLSTDTLLLIATELAHYKANAKQNERQAAYQRRKRLGKGASAEPAAEHQALGKGTSHQRPALVEPLPLTREMQDYLDGKIDSLPPLPGRPSFSERTPANTPAPNPSHALAFDTRGKDVL